MLLIEEALIQLRTRSVWTARPALLEPVHRNIPSPLLSGISLIMRKKYDLLQRALHPYIAFVAISGHLIAFVNVII